MDVYKRLEELDIKLLDPTPKGGIYSTVQPYRWASAVCVRHGAPQQGG